MSIDRDPSARAGADAGARPAGLVAGKYELIRLIGKGGMGSVWEGRHASLGTRVAVKFIEAQYANSQDARQRFDNEARAAATIESKHAIQVFDHGVLEDGRPYIVMELLVGQPLDARLDAVTRMAIPDVARIIHQVCRALSRAHEHGIIHRDLKPENIFLVRSHDDDEEIAKVLDFGIAKMRPTPGATGISSGTKTGTLLGTPFFMSPEQARGLRNVDHRSDLWSLGVIVFKCLTGVLPFDGESLGDLLVKICTSPIPVPSQAAPGIPPEIDHWMMRALDREPDRRFQTAGELADALAAASGVSLRRGPMSQVPGSAAYSAAYSSGRGAAVTPGSMPRPGSVPTPVSYAPLTTPDPYGTPIPAATSAPFTAPSAPVATGSKKGTLLVITLCAVLAGAALVLALSKWAGLGKTPPMAGTSPSSVAVAPTLGASATGTKAQNPSASPSSNAAMLLSPVDLQGLPVGSSSAPQPAAPNTATKPNKAGHGQAQPTARPAPNPAATAGTPTGTATHPAPTPTHPVQKPPQPSEQAGY